jgi:hypothetical protein
MRAKPTSLARLASIVGCVCVAIATFGFVSALIVCRSLNGDDCRFYCRTIGPSMLAALLGTIVCGAMLLKHRRTAGWTLITVGVVIFILELFFPEL